MSSEKNVVQCTGADKHFYDANKYDKCPHCGATASAGHPEKKSLGLFGSKLRRNSSITATQGIYPQNHPKKSEERPAMEKKELFPSNEIQKPVSAIFEESTVPQLQSVQSPSHISASDDVKTTGHWYGKKNNDPVVGWLVCVKGENIGESFPIVSGRNTIGRRETNEIALIGENSVSRENHASIFFDYKKSDFYIKPGEGNSMPYVNDEMITTMTRLQIYDEIELGDCICVFIPLCGENFTWDKYIKKE